MCDPKVNDVKEGTRIPEETQSPDSRGSWKRVPPQKRSKEGKDVYIPRWPGSCRWSEEWEDVDSMSSMKGSKECPWTEEWKIDFSKLDIQKVVAHGTYRTVFRGTYDNQDVADKHPFRF